MKPLMVLHLLEPEMERWQELNSLQIQMVLSLENLVKKKFFFF